MVARCYYSFLGGFGDILGFLGYYFRSFLVFLGCSRWLLGVSNWDLFQCESTIYFLYFPATNQVKSHLFNNNY